MLAARRFRTIVQPKYPVLRVASIVLHASNFHTKRCVREEYRNLQQPPKKHPNVSETDSQQTSKDKPGANKKSSQPWIDPVWNQVKGKLEDTLRAVNKYATGLFYHFGKAREAIREANKKIAEQERDRSDQRLNYNKDIENDGRIQGLPSEREMHRRKWSRKLEFYLDSLQETIFTATRALNDVTGYSSIQKLRKSIELMEHTLEETRSSLKQLKEDYTSAIEERTESQRELNELLQRKNAWSPEELERFTQLYKNDAMNLKKERELKNKVNTMEAKQEELSDDLYRAILTRYHEEQIWSDKIRRTSTWGTCLLMIVNIILFLVFQLLLEPWKRRRLTSSFEDKVKAALDGYAGEQKTTLKQLSATMSNESAIRDDQRAQPASISQSKKLPATDIAVNECNNVLSGPTDESYQSEELPFADPDRNESNVLPSSTTPQKGPNTAWHLCEIMRRKVLDLWHWIECITRKFDAATALQLHAEKTFTNLELYTCSLFLFLCGTTVSRII
ncbi:ZYBA0S05-04830g1_1 [Zygosaccharomyces bailii CLIB 213]|uniref:Sensitive to high expression protein 9, mitochondrial n=1 Tax=Zygosaccharomyces bailii (strain CLIB 213 / ATCC 58445 / CBS 680 / BCRC 21525 / NBRC 1098 / NCYC 1416 / NRRL Y-2227) TaxID=1333698 RepID=A0A8J2T833_ZYGB2|nr:ZYBA0S05-04830g1_1 [Zygosaccharomyces bailii CLIB 213]